MQVGQGVLLLFEGGEPVGAEVDEVCDEEGRAAGEAE